MPITEAATNDNKHYQYNLCVSKNFFRLPSYQEHIINIDAVKVLWLIFQEFKIYHKKQWEN